MLKNKRQRIIHQALIDLGGKAGTRAIAERCGLNINGVSQTLGVMLDDVMSICYDQWRREWVWVVRRGS